VHRLAKTALTLSSVEGDIRVARGSASRRTSILLVSRFGGAGVGGRWDALLEEHGAAVAPSISVDWSATKARVVRGNHQAHRGLSRETVIRSASLDVTIVEDPLLGVSIHVVEHVCTAVLGVGPWTHLLDFSWRCIFRGALVVSLPVNARMSLKLANFAGIGLGLP